MKKLILGLLAVSSFGLIGLPAHADDAVIIREGVDSYIDGNGTTHIIDTDTRHIHNRYGVNDSSGTVIDKDLTCESHGNQNFCGIRSRTDTNTTRISPNRR